MPKTVYSSLIHRAITFSNISPQSLINFSVTYDCRFNCRQLHSPESWKCDPKDLEKYRRLSTCRVGIRQENTDSIKSQRYDDNSAKIRTANFPLINLTVTAKHQALSFYIWKQTRKSNKSDVIVAVHVTRRTSSKWRGRLLSNFIGRKLTKSAHSALVTLQILPVMISSNAPQVKSTIRRNAERLFFFTNSFVYLSGFEADPYETWFTVLALNARLNLALTTKTQSHSFSRVILLRHTAIQHTASGKHERHILHGDTGPRPH
jgi:hypothetical protein